jgi:hypothetical protein
VTPNELVALVESLDDHGGPRGHVSCQQVMARLADQIRKLTFAVAERDRTIAGLRAAYNDIARSRRPPSFGIDDLRDPGTSGKKR